MKSRSLAFLTLLSVSRLGSCSGVSHVLHWLLSAVITLSPHLSLL